MVSRSMPSQTVNCPSARRRATLTLVNFLNEDPSEQVYMYSERRTTTAAMHKCVCACARACVCMCGILTSIEWHLEHTKQSSWRKVTIRHTHIHMCTHAHTRTQTGVCVRVCVCMRMYIYIYAYIHVNIDIYTHIYRMLVYAITIISTHVLYIR